jgi:DNA-binding response OmpR family regulator
MKKHKILLVDDSNTVLMMVTMALNASGYEVVSARDGAEGVAMAVSERPDLILLDIVMPKMSGIEACRLIRAHEVTAGIPIIMVTTRSEASNVETCFKNGCNDYVNKPINKSELLTKVRSVLASGANA